MNFHHCKKCYLLVSLVFLLLVQLTTQSLAFLPALADPLTWTHLSTATGDLPLPSNSTQQTATLILDIDRDGNHDFVIASRKSPGPSLVWYQSHTNSSWTKHLIDSTSLPIEAGGAYADIDRDGDLDIVMGADATDNQMWWWENPYPIYNPNTGWTRRLIKNGGSAKHHDQMFGDFDGDGQVEFVFWNQRARALQMAEIPTNPLATQPWPFTTIYTWASGLEHEGLAQADVDGDGQTDIIGGGRWFKHNSGFNYTANLIDDAMRFTRAAAGQLIVGGRPEIVLVCGDCVGPLKLYMWNGSSWQGRDMLGFDVDHGHSLEIADINGDGQLDVFVAEMRLNSNNPDAKMWIFEGDGAGNFAHTEVVSGYDNHESKIGDLDGDGDLDILGKPYNWQTPRLDIWLNNNTCKRSLYHWHRHVIDANKPWRSIFVESADLDGDNRKDIVTGGWWYKNPGTIGGTWLRTTIGAPLNNLAALHDFDRDGDIDIFGTQGQASQTNANFSWARNNGAGNFTIFNNITPGIGDFLQGIGIAQFQAGADLEIALSWHQGGAGVQMLTVPSTPADTTWPWRRIATHSQDEALSVGDIDRDSDLDLMLGTSWLRNDVTTGSVSGPWSAFTLNNTPLPDRNRLADMNQDGRVDVVVGFEATNTPGKLAWYEQQSDPTAEWTEHIISNMVVGPMSVDVKDMDRDGDWDVIVGEHNLANSASAKLYVFENKNGNGNQWAAHVVYTGDEHHDGAHVVDLDNDGDFDITSIGWGHSRVIVYENKTPACNGDTGEPTPTPTVTVTPTATPTTVTTATSSPTTTPTASLTPTATATQPSAETVTPPPTATPTASLTPTPTPTTTPIIVATATPTATPTATRTDGCTPSEGNVVQNGDFENGTASWSFYTNGSGSFTTAAPAQRCQRAARLQFNRVGNNMQFFQSALALEPNTRYRLSFAAYSNNGRDLGIYLHKHTAGYGSYGLDIATVNLTTQWQSFTYEFTTRNFTRAVRDGRLRFRFVGFATVGDIYWLDAVQLHKVAAVADAAIAEATEPLTETVTLPDFAFGQESEPQMATSTIAIRGLVTQPVDDGVTQSDQPAAGVMVHVYVGSPAEGALVTSLTTDANGGFVVPELPAGIYTIAIVPLPGYTAPQPYLIEQNAGTTVVINEALQPFQQLYLPIVVR